MGNMTMTKYGRIGTETDAFSGDSFSDEYNNILPSSERHGEGQKLKQKQKWTRTKTKRHRCSNNNRNGNTSRSRNRNADTNRHSIKTMTKNSNVRPSILRNKVVLSILVTETAERIAYFGFRSGLVLYFANGLEFSESTSVALVAAVHGLSYLSPVLGAILADNGWGRYNTIFRFAVVYALGLCLIALGARGLDADTNTDSDSEVDLEVDIQNHNQNLVYANADLDADLDAMQTQYSVMVARVLSFVGLTLACLGTGGIKPCVSAFGADQVVLTANNNDADADDDCADDEYDDDEYDDDEYDDDEYDDEYNDAEARSAVPASANVEDDNESTARGAASASAWSAPMATATAAAAAITTAMTYTPVDTRDPEQHAVVLSSSPRILSDALSSPEPARHKRSGNENENDSENENQSDPDADDDPLLREFFNSFYVCINVGALVSFATIPIVRARHGFGASFLVPACFMVTALLLFWSQRRSYKHRSPRNPSQPSLLQTLSMVGSMLLPLQLVFGTRRYQTRPVEERERELEEEQNEHEHELEHHPNQNPEQLRVVRRDAEQVVHLMPLMIFFPVFWMLYDQQGSVWTLQATRLNCHGLQPEQSLLLNPLEIMILVPIFDKILYPWLAAKRVDIRPLRRMEYGMFFTAIAFLLSALLERAIVKQAKASGGVEDKDEDHKEELPKTVSLAWQIPQITVLTVGEILLNVTGLEFAYGQAPERMQTLILAVYLLTTAIGDGLGTLLFATVFEHASPITTLLTCAVCMLANLAGFARVAERWEPYNNKKNETDDDDKAKETVTVTVETMPTRSPGVVVVVVVNSEEEQEHAGVELAVLGTIHQPPRNSEAGWN